MGLILYVEVLLVFVVAEMGDQINCVGGHFPLINIGPYKLSCAGLFVLSANSKKVRRSY